jgi:hypothetical protein
LLRFYDLTQPISEFGGKRLIYIFELAKKRLLSFKPKPGNATRANTLKNKGAHKQSEAEISEIDHGCLRMQRLRNSDIKQNKRFNVFGKRKEGA